MFTLGLDGLDITINTDVKLEQNHYTFKNQAGKELGNLAAVKMDTNFIYAFLR